MDYGGDIPCVLAENHEEVRRQKGHQPYNRWFGLQVPPQIYC